MSEGLEEPRLRLEGEPDEERQEDVTELEPEREQPPPPPEEEGRGVLLYLAQEGRGIGLLNKLRAYKLQEEGLDTVDANLELGLPADLRDYGIGAQILADLGLSSIRILTNNPKKIRGLEGYGLSVAAQVPIEHTPNPHNEAYLRAKAERMGHTLHHQGLNLDAELLHAEREHDRRQRE